MSKQRDSDMRDVTAWAAIAINKTGAINSDCGNAMRADDPGGAKVYLKSALAGVADLQRVLTHALVHAERIEDAKS